jgi:two-component system response regulator YesN
MYADSGNVYLYEQVGDVLCFLVKSDTVEEMEDRIESGIKKIRDLMVEYPDMKYFISVGKWVERIRDVNISYADASKKFAERYMHRDSCVFYGNDSGKEKESISIDRSVSDKRIDNFDINSIDVGMISNKTIYNFMRQGTISETEDLVEDYFKSLGREALESVMLRQYVLVESLFSAINLLESLGLNREESLQLLGGQSEPMKYNDSVETAKEYVRKIIKEVIEYRNKISDQKYLGIIEKAKDFIRDNYQNEDMSLQLVSSNVNVSSNHFSAIFRKETGITFIDYLTTVRMEKAKDLLTTTSMKTSDVGFEVGYRDPHYFSYIFKKTQGMSPKEFRRQKKEK